ncbi:MAG: D-sedoheptulose 7-phosphate isomerase [Candidatus Cloacimonadia bacterium]|jgi:D-sedoheptulose 7-phosphate isomerase
MKKYIRQGFNDAADAIKRFNTEENLERIEKMAKAIVDCFQKGNKVLICGNGGSNCDALHFAEEFTGRFRKDRPALPVIPISESSHITCVGNDYGFEEIFARGVEAYGKKEDIVIGISTSGNSENVIKALKKGKEIGLITMALLGRDGGKLKDSTDLELIVQAETTDRIQEIHMLALHIVIEMVERILFPENYA